MQYAGLTLLAVTAHPDDENGMGGTLAYYASEGVRVVLLTATRGEAGTIFDPSAATPENEAEVREEELRCACRVLGIEPPRFMGCSDGAVRECQEAALEPLVRTIRSLRPQVMLTFGADGVYGHPDHVAVHHLATRAWKEAGDPALFPEHLDEGLEPFQPARLFYFALPQSAIDLWSQFADLKVELNGESLLIRGVPDDQLSVVMDVQPFIARKLESFACHRSQINPNSPFAQIAPEVRAQQARFEHYVQAGGEPTRGNDLFAGLELNERGGGSTERDAAVLTRNVTSRLGYVRLYELVRRETTEREILPVLAEMIEEEREALSRLGTRLRQIGHPLPTKEPETDRMLAQYRARRGTLEHMGFLQRGIQTAIDWYDKEGADPALTPATRALLKDLGEIQRRNIERLRKLVNQMRRIKEV